MSLPAIRAGRTLALAVLFVAGAGNTHAAERSGGDQALRQAQVLLQKLSADKAVLEKEVARLSEELKGVTGQIQETRTKLATAEEGLVKAGEANARLVDRVRADHAKIAEMSATHRQEKGDAHADILLLRSAIEEREARIAVCRKKNEEMFSLNAELIKAWHDKDVVKALRQSEPVTGFGSVRMENEAQEYRFRLEDLRTEVTTP